VPYEHWNVGYGGRANAYLVHSVFSFAWFEAARNACWTGVQNTTVREARIQRTIMGKRKIAG
jgi:hypothetical protein